MGVNSAARAEKMLGCAGVEAIARQDIFALQEAHLVLFGGGNDGPSHPAVRTIAATNRIKTLAESHFETHGTTMASAR